MPTISLPEPPPPFTCSLCQGQIYVGKAGPSCTGCPAFHGTHYFPNDAWERGDETVCDILVLAEHPEAPPRPRPDEASKARYNQSLRLLAYHPIFDCEGGRVVRAAVKDLKEQNEYNCVRINYACAVRCAVDTPNKAMIQACQGPLKQTLSRIANARERENAHGPLVIVALGTKALQALGIQVQSEKEAVGRSYEALIGNLPITAFFAMSLKAVAVAVGKYNAFRSDLKRAFDLVIERQVVASPREELSAGYVYPKTIEAVRDVLQLVRNYSEEGIHPMKWVVAADTETRTLHPHRHSHPCILFSVSWAPGKAASIPLWHPECPYKPEDAWREVVAFLESGKPTIWHNGKFDWKVLKQHGYDYKGMYWDTMLAEHALEEDKKGLYGLKVLTKQWFPEYAGYEDKLQDILDASDPEGDTKGKIETKSVATVPQKILDAMAFLKLKPTFQPKKLQQILDNLMATEDHDASLANAMRLVITAKKAGEFRATKVKEVKEEADHGYESVPLTELEFYAAVDVDVGRRLAINQMERIREEQEQINRMRRSMLAVQDGMVGLKHQLQIRCPESLPIRTLVKDFYVPRSRAFAKIEHGGIRVDREYLKQAATNLDVTIIRTGQQLRAMTGDPSFKPNSGKQLAKALFTTGMGYLHPEQERAEELARDNPKEVQYHNGRLAYQAHHYTMHGAEQTSEAVLKSLVARFEDPLSNITLTFKKASKAKNSFLVNVDRLSVHDGYIHPGYNLHGTGTGRTSSSSGVKKIGFNNQNIPKGELGGVTCKKLFLPDDSESQVIVNIDAKGAEVTIFNTYAKDEALTKALIDGLDMHSFFSSRILNPAIITQGLTGEERRLSLKKASIDEDHPWTYEDFVEREDYIVRGVGNGDEKVKETWEHPELVAYGKKLKKLRDNTKRVVFGILYGAGARKIADIAGIAYDQAKLNIDTLFSLFPSIPTFIEDTHWHLDEFGFVETWSGRRRRFQIKKAPKKLIAQAKRRAVNFLVQGENSDVVLRVLVWLDQILEHDFPGARILMTVHDSIVIQMPKKYLGQLRDLVLDVGTKRIAVVCPWLNPVPYRWDIEVGPSYGELMPLNSYLEKQATTTSSPVRYEGYTEEEILEDLREATDDEEGGTSGPRRGKARTKAVKV